MTTNVYMTKDSVTCIYNPAVETDIDWGKELVKIRPQEAENDEIDHIQNTMRLLMGGPVPVDVGIGSWRVRVR